MQSAVRLAANAANAQLSTGPRTPEGKARSSQNARKHGLTARHFVVTEDEREEFDEFLAEYEETVAPDGPVEATLFQEMTVAAWNLRRIRRLEAEAASGPDDPLLDDNAAPTLDRLARYHRANERSLYRALGELRKLQTERAFRAGTTRAELPPLASASVVAKGTHLPKSGRLLQDIVRGLEAEAQVVNSTRNAYLSVLDGQPQPKEPTAAPAASQTPYVREPKIGRNEPCPCGSGVKYTRCCGA